MYIYIYVLEQYQSIKPNQTNTHTYILKGRKMLIFLPDIVVKLNHFSHYIY